MKKEFFRTQGLTMIELIVATTISTIVLGGLFASLGGIYFSQKKINATQSFASESRFLMEQITQLVRNNTIDYDQFFTEVGPDTTDCENFFSDQVPAYLIDPIENTAPLAIPLTNNESNREAIGYSNIFYWNVATGSIDRYRNLGGKRPVTGSEDKEDPCAQAWHGTLNTLYLINRERTEKTAIRLLNNGADRLEKQRLLGVDTVGDGVADRWGFVTDWNEIGSNCQIYVDVSKTNLLGTALGVVDEQTCARGHDWANISPEAIEVLAFEFIPSPNRDPYLNYRIDTAQTQPNVFLRLHTQLRRPGDFGVRGDTPIELIQQTMASSRIFGDPR
jgi:type II secretory pathway pseudopilin PulG